MESELDILNSIQNVDLSKVETSFPLLKTGNVQAQIVEMTFSMKEKKDGDKYPNCMVKYALAQPWTTVAVDGAPAKDVQPGFTFSENIYMAPVTKKDGSVDNFGIQRLALLRECIHGKAAEGAKIQKEDFLGQTVMVKLKFDPAPRDKKTGEVFGPRTDVDGYVRKAR